MKLAGANGCGFHPRSASATQRLETLVESPRKEGEPLTLDRIVDRLWWSWACQTIAGSASTSPTPPAPDLCGRRGKVRSGASLISRIKGGNWRDDDRVTAIH